MPRRAALILVCLAALAASGTATGATRSDKRSVKGAAPRPLIARSSLESARAYARARRGQVSFAVIATPTHRPRGVRPNEQFPSASVSKAMLMVAVLRRAGNRPVSRRLARLLKPMITISDNDAAQAVYAYVGPGGLRAVARAARMRHFIEVGHWAGARLTAADQARFFYRIDRLVPRRHRNYARTLLASVVPSQRWGIPRAADGRYKVFLKGGWRPGINHQVALLEKDGRRIAIAILTNESGPYGQATEEGIARRLLR